MLYYFVLYNRIVWYAHITESGQLLYLCVKTACEALISAESQLNQLDTAVGDSDCGSTLKSGAQGWTQNDTKTGCRLIL